MIDNLDLNNILVSSQDTILFFANLIHDSLNMVKICQKFVWISFKPLIQVLYEVLYKLKRLVGR